MKKKQYTILSIIKLLKILYEFTRGDWEKEEDLQILKFVLNNGSKWSSLSKNLNYRTEHAVKNRFFSLLSSFLLIPTRQIKKEVNYRNSYLISSTLNFHKNLMEKKKIENSFQEQVKFQELIKLKYFI